MFQRPRDIALVLGTLSGLMGAGRAQSPESVPASPAAAKARMDENDRADRDAAAKLRAATEQQQLLQGTRDRQSEVVGPQPAPTPSHRLEPMRQQFLAWGALATQEAFSPTPLTASGVVSLWLAQGVPPQHYMDRDLMTEMRQHRAAREARVRGAMANARPAPGRGDSEQPGPSPVGEPSRGSGEAAPGVKNTSAASAGPVTAVDVPPAGAGAREGGARSAGAPAEGGPQPRASGSEAKRAHSEPQAAVLPPAPTNQAAGLVTMPDITDSQRLMAEELIRKNGGDRMQLVDDDGKGNYVYRGTDKDGNSQTFWLGKNQDGKLLLLRTFHDEDGVPNLSASGPKLTGGKNPETGKFEPGGSLGKVAVTYGELGADAWLIPPTGLTAHANLNGKLAEVSAGGSVPLGGKNPDFRTIKPSFGVTLDGPGGSAGLSFLTSPECGPNGWETVERGAGVSGGAGALKFGMKNGQLVVKVLGVGVSLTYKPMSLETGNLAPDVRQRLEAACPAARGVGR